MLLKNKILLIVPVLALAVACNKTKPGMPKPEPCCELNPPAEDSTECSFWQASPGLVSISGPATASAGQPVQLTVGITGLNGCADGAQITGNANGNDITFTGNVHYAGCICTQALTEVSNTYSFTPSQAGTYTFHGTTYEGNPVTHTIIVQ